MPSWPAAKCASGRRRGDSQRTIGQPRARAAAALGPLLWSLGLLVSGLAALSPALVKTTLLVGKLATALLATPIGWFVAAVGGAAALIWRDWEKFQPLFADWADGLIRAGQGVVDFVAGAFTVSSLYHVFGMERFKPVAADRQNFVLSVGSLTPLKGFDFLIRVMARYRGANRPALVIASNFQNGPERAYLEQLASELGVDIVGFSDPGIDDLRNRLLWTPESPNLIDADLELLDKNDRVIDRVSSYTAMRSAEVQRNRFVLNNRAYHLRMVLDQGYWPDGGLTAPNDAAYRRDVELAKEMGFNGVRKHQKIESPRFLYWADRLGLLALRNRRRIAESRTSVPSTCRCWSFRFRTRSFRRMRLRSRTRSGGPVGRRARNGSSRSLRRKGASKSPTNFDSSFARLIRAGTTERFSTGVA